jgi:hypothetical protein
MTALQEREKALEEKYFLDLEMVFRVKSRRDRLLAQWVSEMIGAADIEAYVSDLIDVRLTAKGDEGVVAKILADVRSAGKILDEKEVRARMAKFTVLAAEAIGLHP